jgi:membrane protease YdiL (CAAX protease family)
LGEGARAVSAAAGETASSASAGAAASASSAASAAKDQGPGTIDAVLPMLKGGEGQAGRFFSVLTVTSVLAPLLEEVVFRGFLLASLTKWLPTPGAVVFSSVVFGAAHLAPRDFPQLVTLGIVLGFSYARTRNLLTPMFIHSLWNSGVLIVVAALVATGNESALPGIAGGGQ